MLATLNSRQIVDEIVKDTVTNNDPHDAVQISPRDGAGLSRHRRCARVRA
ncbi:hypothetical protein ACVW0I_003847 [Bradyrhizobium sp. LM6.11]